MTTPMATSYCCHDHLVILVDNETFNKPPGWLADNFTIVDGGTHQGGASKNKLIVLEDGTYISVATWFTKPSQPNELYDQPIGTMVFYLTTLRPFDAQKNFEVVQRALTKGDGDGALDVRYGEPAQGGRSGVNGQDVRWRVTKPLSQSPQISADDGSPRGRLDIPWFCHDLTPRVLRVPFDDAEATKHKCEANGIAGVDVLVPADKLTLYSKLYSSITGDEPHQIDDKTQEGLFYKLTTPTSQDTGAVVRLRVPTSPEDEKWLEEKGPGVRSIQLSTKDKKREHGTMALAADGLGASILLS